MELDPLPGIRNMKWRKSRPAKPAMMTGGMKLLERMLTLCIRAPSQKLATRPLPKPRKLLVMKLSGLGDAVMVRSLIEHMREQDPALQIGVLGGPSTIEMLTWGHSAASYHYRAGRTAARDALELLARIRAARYDTLIDFEQYSMLSAAFGRATSIRTRIGFAGMNRTSRAGLFTHPVEIACERSIWENFANLARVAAPGMPNSLAPCAPTISEDARRWISEWLHPRVEADRELIAFHLGAASRMAYRRWPLECFLELAQGLQRRRPRLAIVLTGASSERVLAEEFIRGYDGVALDATALGALGRTAALLERCSLLVSNDTGVMHLGAAIGVRTMGLFGPSNPRHWAPRGLAARYIYATTAPCSPCIDVFRRVAPAACFNRVSQQCLRELSPQRVLEAIEQSFDKPMGCYEDSRAS